jgi:hypothetical protein
MIIVHLLGGLGNQLVQYAAGRRLAHVHNTDLALLTVDYAAADSPRRYELDSFAVQARTIGLRECEERVADRARRQVPMTFIDEPHSHFLPYVLQAPDESYFYGYWQSERYFSDIGPLLRKELTLVTPLGEANQRILDEIQSPAGPAVSLHVRLTDYISEPANRDIYVTCGLDYYQRGIEHLLARVSGARFFVFSDDPVWTAANLLPHIRAPRRLVTGNENRGALDLALMRHCRHHVIANSTFSWWGAWLSDAPGKHVVAPDRWFVSTVADTSDLIPAEWTRLPLVGPKS